MTGGGIVPNISIIVPVYKVEALLDRCVSSIRNQSYGDFELLLVDDGSPDNCGQLCEEYASMDSRIRVFHKENGGQGSARNLALDWVASNSDSQWITFVDSDDWVHRDYLRLLLETAEKENVEVSMCDYLTTDRVQEDAPADGARTFRMDAETAIVDYYYLCTAPWGKLYAKRFFMTLRFPEIRAYEDAFITHIPVYEAGTVAYHPAKLYYYYENQTSTTRKKWSTRNLSQIEAHEVRLAYCKEHGYERAYCKELEHYVIACFAQATALNQAVKEDRGMKVHQRELRPKLLPLLRHARERGLFPFNQKYLWIYEIAYPVKPVWVLRNILEAKLGLKFPR